MADILPPTISLAGSAEAQTQALTLPGAPPGDNLPAVEGYEVLGVLGRGGMGVVYRARQAGLNRLVALKMILAGGHASAHEQGRFRREAEAVARLQHPNIVQIHAVGEHQGQPFFSLEYCSGGSLAERLRGAPLPVAQASALVETLARAMHVAHQHQIVHRDLKPANILLQPTDDTLPAEQQSTRAGADWVAAFVPKIADFGLAKTLDNAAAATAAGTVLGTPSYMAPEQANDQADVGPPADVYALGAILYELLTGRPPFRAANHLDTILQAIHDDPVPPSRLAPKLPRDLETICLKCLHKTPARRYASAAELADDLARFRNQEPVRARPLGVPERLRKWARRRPAAATLLALAMAVVVSVAGLAAALHRQAQASRAAALVETLAPADTPAVLRLIDELAPYRAWAIPLLRDLAQRSPADSRPRLHAALALWPADDREIDYLTQRLLRASPEEVTVICAALKSRSADLGPRFDRLLGQADLDREARFRAAVALAAFDPANPRWESLCDEVADTLVGSNALEVRQWVDSLRPVQGALIDPLRRLFMARRGTLEGEVASVVLAEYAAGQPALLVDLIREAESRQVAPLARQLKPRADAGAVLLEAMLTEKIPPMRAAGARLPTDVDPEDFRDDLAGLHARAALALVVIGRDDPVWPLLQPSPDCRLRSYLTHQFAVAGIDPRILLHRLDVEPDAGVRRALLLALGAYRRDAVSLRELEQFVDKLLRTYEADPDPGVHGAVEWLLERWSHTERLTALKDQLRSAPATGPRRWYINSQGQTMTIVAAGTDALLGSPYYEHGREETIVPPARSGNERRHLRRIERSFAIAAHEVTSEQFDRFQKLERSRYNPEPACPATNVTWYDAARYCRWLSEQEGVKDDQMCYPPLDQIKAGMKLPADYLERSGYRLPTEAEWECACRVGTATRFSFGADTALLQQYGWFQANAGDRTWPVGRLKPNDLGLFDMHGNAFEWCDDAYRPYAATALDEALQDDGDASAPHNDQPRVLRGGESVSGWSRARSGHRMAIVPTFKWPTSGFRVARTLPSPSVGAAPPRPQPAWRVQFFAWSPREDGLPHPADWPAVLAAKPLDEAPVQRLEFSWGLEAPTTRVPADYFAVVATAEVHLPAGRYELFVLHDDGARVFVDGVKVLAWWNGDEMLGDIAWLDLNEGKHSLRVEYYELLAESELRFTMRKND